MLHALRNDVAGEEEQHLLTDRSGRHSRGISASPSNSSSSTSSSQWHRKIDKRMQVFVLVCASMIPFGAHYMKHALGPLKPFAVSGQNGRYMPISSLEFGAFLSAVNWPNMLLPLLAGIFVDAQGHERGALLFTTLALLGHLLFVAGLASNTTLGSMEYFWIAIAGRVLYGAGESGAGVTQGAMIGRWFPGHRFGFAIGFSESVHYLSNWVGKALPAHLAQQYDSYVTALWIGSLFLFLSCVFAVIYAIGVTIANPDPFVFALAKGKHDTMGRALKSAPKPKHKIRQTLSGVLHSVSVGHEDDVIELDSGDDEVRQDPMDVAVDSTQYQFMNDAHDVYGTMDNNSSPYRDSVVIPDEPVQLSYFQFHLDRVGSLGRLFWLIGILHLCFSNISNLFGGISTDLIATSHPKMATSTAGLIASIDAVLPIFMAPFIGYLVDRIGGRLWFCCLAALSACTCFVEPWKPMVFLSICTAMTPTLIKSAIPLAVPRSVIGTAFGVYALFESFGGTVGHLLFGYLREVMSSYSEDLDTLIGMCIAALVVTLIVMAANNGDRRI